MDLTGLGSEVFVRRFFIFLGRAFPALAAAVMVLGTQAFLNRPIEVPPGPPELHSLSFNPVGRWGNPEVLGGWANTQESIERDLRAISSMTRRVRLYTLSYDLDAVPGIAERLGMRVTLGVWVDPRDPERTRREMDLAADLASRFPWTVEAVLVGNEVLLRREMSVRELGALMDEMRRRVSVPVSTGEVTGVWIANLSLGDHADFVAVHVLPYWGEARPRDAVAQAMREYETVLAAFPRLPVKIAEFGWPSGRLNRGLATTSPLDQTRVVREFAMTAAQRGIAYNIVEAFDQPWKTNEGAPGPYWGLFDARGEVKFSTSGSVSPDPAWAVRSAVGVVLGLALSLTWVMARPRISLGESFALGLVGQAAGFLVSTGSAAVFEQYWTTGLLLSWVVGLPLLGFLAWATYERLREAADILLRRPSILVDGPVPNIPADPPMISVHVPASREHLAVVTRCLRSLARLDWPRYEVVVVLNNTDDEGMAAAMRAEVAALSADGDAMFRLVHVPVLAGFKAGALNLALRESDPRASIIAVVDSDYEVDSDWLRRAADMISSGAALAQFPQEHAEDTKNPARRAMNDEYAGFFDGGMAQREMDNALVVHGTMVAIRRDALEAAGGWSEHHICEDTELGLRLLAAGHRLAYSRRRAGRGVLPDDMPAFRRQRDRWVYGGMRILAEHRRILLLPGRLSALQRLHFLGGWSGWWGDAAALLASVAALVWAAFMLASERGDPPPPGLSVAVLAASAAALSHTFLLHALRVRRGVGAATRAALAGMSLQAVVALAVARGLLAPGRPFRVTPKGGGSQHLGRRLFGVRLEAGLLALQWTAVAWVAWDNAFLSVTALWLFSAVIAVQSLPNLAAVVLAVLDRPFGAAQAAAENGAPNAAFS